MMAEADEKIQFKKKKKGRKEKEEELIVFVWVMDQEGLMREWNPFFCGHCWLGLIICGGNPDDAAAVANNCGGPDCHC